MAEDKRWLLDSCGSYAGQRQQDRLGIGQQTVNTDQLAAELEELPGTPCLEALVAKDRSSVAQTNRQRVRLHRIDEGRMTDAVCSGLRARSAAKTELIGLREPLASELPGEQLGMLDDRRVHPAVAVPGNEPGQLVFEPAQRLPVIR
ncbi:MAG: hypothetical protein R2849_23545 [Thermomicrobiales bacterium]